MVGRPFAPQISDTLPATNMILILLLKAKIINEMEIKKRGKKNCSSGKILLDAPLPCSREKLSLVTSSLLRSYPHRGYLSTGPIAVTFLSEG